MDAFSPAERLAVHGAQPMPLYHQIFQVLRQKIERGELRHGEFLPSEIVIAEQLGVSRVTVKRALDELEASELVDRKRGRGTQVTFRYEPKMLRAPLTSMLESLTVMGRETSVSVLSFARVGAPAHVASTLKIPLGAPVDRAVRVRSNAALPFAYYVSHTLPLGDGFNAKSLKSHPRLELFQMLGVRLREVDQIITASAASAEIASALDVPLSTALLQLTRIYIDANHRPVDHLLGFYRPDRFQYHMHLTAPERKR